MLISLKRFDPVFKFLIWYSIIVYFIEITTGSVDSRHGHPFFLWSERIVASLLTIEYLERIRRDGFKYTVTALGIIDLLAIAPFWAGFFIPEQYLKTIRALRILRLLKWFRYSRPMQLVALGFYKAWPQIKPLLFVMFIISLTSTAIVFEFEKSNTNSGIIGIINAFYSTTVNVGTSGYGDMASMAENGSMLISSRVVIVISFVPALIVFSAIVGVIGESFQEIFEVERKSEIDPIADFVEERKMQLHMKQTNKFHRKPWLKGSAK